MILSATTFLDLNRQNMACATILRAVSHSSDLGALNTRMVWLGMGLDFADAAIKSMPRVSMPPRSRTIHHTPDVDHVFIDEAGRHGGWDLDDKVPAPGKWVYYNESGWIFVPFNTQTKEV